MLDLTLCFFWVMRQWSERRKKEKEREREFSNEGWFLLEGPSKGRGETFKGIKRKIFEEE